MLNSEKTLTAEYADDLGYAVQKIEWKIPKLNTLLKPVAASFNSLTTDNVNYSASWNLEDSEYYIYTIEKGENVEVGLILEDFPLPYQIKDLYLPTAINNSIECIVTTTEGKIWEGKQEFYFSSGGNQGTQYGFGIGFKEGYPSALNRLYGVSKVLNFDQDLNLSHETIETYKYYIKNTYYLEDLDFNNLVLLCDYGEGITNNLKYNETIEFSEEDDKYYFSYIISDYGSFGPNIITFNNNLQKLDQTSEGWYTIVEAHLYDPEGKDITETIVDKITWEFVYDDFSSSKKYGFTILTKGQISDSETDAHLSGIKNLVDSLNSNEALIYSYSYRGLDGNILKATVNFPVTLTSMDGIASPEEPAAADDGGRNIKFTAQIAIGSKQSSVKSLQAPTYISYDSMGKNPTYSADNLMLIDNDGNEEEGIVWKLVQKDLLANPDGYFSELLIKENSGKYSLVPPSLYHDTPELIMLSANDSGGNEFWHQPIVITRNAYEFNLINNWDEELTIDKEKGAILSTLIGSGLKNSENKFSGILLGAVGKENSKFGNTGLYGFKNGVATFGLKENGSFFFGPDADNQIRFDTNGEGLSIKTNELFIDIYEPGVGAGMGKEFLIDTNATGSNPIMLYRAAAGENAKFVLTGNGSAYIGGWELTDKTMMTRGYEQDGTYAYQITMTSIDDPTQVSYGLLSKEDGTIIYNFPYGWDSIFKTPDISSEQSQAGFYINSDEFIEVYYNTPVYCLYSNSLNQIIKKKVHYACFKNTKQNTIHYGWYNEYEGSGYTASYSLTQGIRIFKTLTIPSHTMGMSTDPNKYAFWSGETNGALGSIYGNSNASFKVTQDGKLYATGAEISGDVVASGSSIFGRDLSKKIEDDVYLQISQDIFEEQEISINIKSSSQLVLEGSRVSLIFDNGELHTSGPLYYGLSGEYYHMGSMIGNTPLSSLLQDIYEFLQRQQ